MRVFVLLSSLLLMGSCGPSPNKAVLECTAQPSGLVTDCVVLSEISPGFGQYAVQQVTEDARCAVAKAGEPLIADDGPAETPCLSSHPGSADPLPRRFQTTWGLIY